MSDAYRRHLEALHARLETPDEIVLATLAEVSRAKVEERRRIAEGEANEVHSFRLGDGLAVIMRIARSNARGFEAERWAIEACRNEGVPVPEILLIKRVESGGGPVDICIQRKIEGELLSNCLDLTRERLRVLTAEAGDILSRVHRVHTQGLGYLNGVGEGAFASFDDLMAGFLGEEGAYVALADPGLRCRADPARVRRDHPRGPRSGADPGVADAQRLLPEAPAGEGRPHQWPDRLRRGLWRGVGK